MRSTHPPAAKLRLPEPEHQHVWELRGVEYEDQSTVRCFECVACPAVRYE